MGYGNKKFTNMLASTLEVILINDEKYDAAITEAMNTYWKATPFEFVNINDIDDGVIMKDESKSFLAPLNIELTRGKTGAMDVTKAWLSILPGGRKKIQNYSDNDVIVLAPFNLYGDEMNTVNCAYRLDYMIKGMNDVILLTDEKKLEGGPASLPFKLMDEINKKTKLIKTKTLIVNKDIKNFYQKFVNDKDDFVKSYKYKYEFVSDEEFKEIMQGNDPDKLCLFVAAEVNKHIFIYEPATRDIVYMGWGMSGLCITSKDLTNIVNKASGK
jgi:hypothetical protein